MGEWLEDFWGERGLDRRVCWGFGGKAKTKEKAKAKVKTTAKAKAKTTAKAKAKTTAKAKAKTTAKAKAKAKCGDSSLRSE